LLAYTSIEVVGPSQVFSWVSPDIQGSLWVWGSGCSDVWGSRWGGWGNLVSRLAMWFVVWYSSTLLAYSLKFSSDVC
jgi:hypothetical protein